MTIESDKTHSLRRKVILSAVWLIGTRWLLRLVGLASTMIMARLLMPEDFGVVAGVTAVVAILNGLFDFGFNLALMRSKEHRREDYDTAWTLRVVKMAAFAALLVAVSPVVALYAKDENLIAISAVIALGLAVRGFDNIGTVRFEKEMHYERLFAVRVYPRLVGALATVGLALWLRSYWAIVFGTLAQQLAFTIFSFLLCEFRPRFRLQGAAAMWSFSKWIVLISISRQVYAAFDRFLLSGIVGKRELGFFSVSSSLAALVSTELIGAAGSALIPGYAKLRDEPARLRSAFVSSQGALAAMLLPAVLILMIQALPLTHVVLGSQWTNSAPMLAAFGVFYMAYTLVENLNSFMAVTGLQKTSAKVGVTRTLLFLALVYPSFQLGGILFVIAMKTALSFSEYLILVSRCCIRLGMPMGRYLLSFWRSLGAGTLMAAAMMAFEASLAVPPLAELMLVGGAGTGVYLSVLFALWALSGKPDGLERLLLDALMRVRRSRPT
jgi:O-antigen/teichoic acid export membrane protein